MDYKNSRGGGGAGFLNHFGSALCCIFNLRQFPLLVRVTFPLARFQVHYRVQSPAKAKKRVSSVKRKACPVVGGASKLHRTASAVGCAHDCSMANKENELTCSDDARRNCGLPVNPGDASKMAGAASKHSDFTEVRARLPPHRHTRGARSAHPRLCSVVEGPRSHDSHPFWKEPAIKSGTNAVAKERQRAGGLPDQVREPDIRNECRRKAELSPMILPLPVAGLRTPACCWTAYPS